MILFYLLFFLTIVLAFIDSRKVHVKMAWLPFLIMLLLCGLRGEDVGTDTYNYLSHYKYEVGERIEPLYSLTIDICHYIGLTPHQFIFVTALLTFVPLYIFVRKYSVNPCFSALIYISYSATFFGLAFNGVRQAIAMSFLIFSIYYLSKKDRVIRSLIFLIIAILFHYSCLVLLPFFIALYFVRSISKEFVYIALIVSFIFGITFGQNDYFLQFFRYFEIISDSNVAKNYMQYMDEGNVSSLNILGLLSNMLPFSLYSIFLYDTKNKSSILYMFLVTGAVLSNVFISIHFIYRLVAYFILPILIILPETQLRTKGFRYYGLCAMNAIMLLWYFYNIVRAEPSYANGIFPYSFYF